MRTVECRIAMQHLSAYAVDPRSEGAGLNLALDHIRHCPDCSRKIGYLVRALNTNAVDQLNCQVCQERLPEYVAATAPERATRGMREVALHLALCPHCAAACDELVNLVAVAQGERGTAPLVYPELDLKFIDPKRHWRLERLGRISRLVVAFSDELLRSLELPRQPDFAASGLKSEQPAGSKHPAPLNLRPLALIGEAPNRDVTIAIEPARNDPAHCTIAVHVGIPSRGGWPNLRGTQVALRRGDVEIAGEVTDAHGNAVFERVAVDDLARLEFVIERGADE